MRTFRVLGILAAFAAVLATAPAALAHSVTNSSLSCNQLDFDYAYFSSTDRVPITLTWNVGSQTIATQTVETLGASGTITVSPPDLSPYQGQLVSVTGTWTWDGGGSFTDSAVTYCSSPQGPAGPQGPSGGAGPQGPAGPAGTAGVTVTPNTSVSGVSATSHPKKRHKKHHKKPTRHATLPQFTG